MTAPLNWKEVKSHTPSQKQALRRLCQTDLYFLTNDILRDSSQPELKPFHRDICDWFPRCHPDIPLSDWSPTKEYCLLGARGILKSTILSAFILQAILCFPNIRVLFIGATKGEQAQDTIQVVRNYFEANAIIPHLFPEYLPLTRGNEFVVAARTDDTLTNATLFPGSFLSVTTGQHCDLLVCDDPNASANPRSDAATLKTVDAYDTLAPLRESTGYTVLAATRWGEKDLASTIQARAKETGSAISVLELPAWKTKSGQPNQAEIDLRDSTNTLTAEDVDLLWPEKLTKAFLFDLYRKSPKFFLSQYLLRIPKGGIFEATQETLLVPQALLESRRVPFRSPQDISQDEVPVLNGDLASVSEKGQDCCCLVGGLWDVKKKHLLVNAIIHEKFAEEQHFLAEVSSIHEMLAYSRRAVHFRIENVREAEPLWKEKLGQLGVEVQFQHPSWEPHSRAKRIQALFKGIHEGQVSFGAEEHWQELLRQICSGHLHARRQDLLDSLAQLFQYCQTITKVDVGIALPPLDHPMYLPPIDTGLSFEEQEAYDSGYDSVEQYRAARAKVWGK